MADTRDLKSLVKYLTCGFESRSWHFLIRTNRGSSYGILQDQKRPFCNSGQKLRLKPS